MNESFLNRTGGNLMSITKETMLHTYFRKQAISRSGFLLFLALLLVSCSPANNEPGLKIVGKFDVERNEYESYITGTLENTSGKTLRMVGILFPLCTSSNYRLYDAADLISSLGAGQKWKFRALLTEEARKDWKLCDGMTPTISGF